MTEDRFVLMAPWQYEQLKAAIGDRLPSESFADYVKRKPVPSAEVPAPQIRPGASMIGLSF